MAIFFNNGSNDMEATDIANATLFAVYPVDDLGAVLKISAPEEKDVKEGYYMFSEIGEHVKEELARGKTIEEVIPEGFECEYDPTDDDYSVLRVLRAEEYDAAERYDILDKITKIKERITNWTRVKRVNFDFLHFEAEHKGNGVLLLPHPELKVTVFHDGKTEKDIRIVMEGITGDMERRGCWLVEEPVVTDSEIVFRFYCGTLMADLPEKGVFLVFSEDETYKFTTSDIKRVLDEIHEFGGIVLGADGTVLLNTVTGENIEGFDSFYLKGYLETAKYRTYYDTEVGHLWDGDCYSYQFAVDGKVMVATYTDFTLEDVQKAFKQRSREHLDMAIFKADDLSYDLEVNPDAVDLAERIRFFPKLEGIKPGLKAEIWSMEKLFKFELDWHGPSCNVGWYPLVSIEDAYGRTLYHDEDGENELCWEGFMRSVADGFIKDLQRKHNNM